MVFQKGRVDMSFKIFVDSAANIPAEDVKKYDIDVISFVNYVNGEELVCFNPDLTPEQEREVGKKYYDAIREGLTTKTSLINMARFMEAFEPALSRGEDILYISLSKNISGTYQASLMAAEELLEEYPERKIEIVDSLNASLGQGLHAITASELRSEGEELEKVAELIRNDVPKMNGVFTVGDLKYLARSGRIRKTVALAGNMLNIKPILRGTADGFIVEFKKIRGRKKSLDELVSLLASNIEKAESQIIGIAHADAFEEALKVAEKIKAAVKVKGIIITAYDFCTGSHVGPDSIAIFFKAKDRELSAGLEPLPATVYA